MITSSNDILEWANSNIKDSITSPYSLAVSVSNDTPYTMKYKGMGFKEAVDYLENKNASLNKKLKETMNNMERVTKVDCIYVNGPCTTVKWADGTTTTVKCSYADDKVNSLYFAFCAALAKKIYGNNNKLHHMIDTHTEQYFKAKKAKEKQENMKKAIAEEKRLHNKKIAGMARRLKHQNEAEAYAREHYKFVV